MGGAKLKEKISFITLFPSLSLVMCGTDFARSHQSVCMTNVFLIGSD